MLYNHRDPCMNHPAMYFKLRANQMNRWKDFFTFPDVVEEEEEAQGAAEFPEEEEQEDVMEIGDNDSEVCCSYSDSVGCILYFDTDSVVYVEREGGP